MSVPKTLAIPEGVLLDPIETDRGVFAAHTIRSRVFRRGHVLLIPGWTGSKEDFTPVLPLLADAGFDVVAYDQRGQFETSGRSDDDYSLEGLAADALAVARTAFFGETFHVLGHSFGGLVAQTVGIDSPSRLESLSLLCSGPGALGDSPTRPLKRIVSAIGKAPLLQIHEIREQGIKRPAAISAFLAKRFVSNAPASLKAFTQLLIDAPDRIDQLAAVDVPFWVGRGADDDAWPHDVQALMAERLGTQIVVLPSAAHSPAVEAPEEFVEAWLPFVRGA